MKVIYRDILSEIDHKICAAQERDRHIECIVLTPQEMREFRLAVFDGYHLSMSETNVTYSGVDIVAELPE